MKYGDLVFLVLILAACQKEPETVDVKKVFMCAFNKKSEVCSSLNSTEEKALSCLTNSGEFSKKECDEIKLYKGPAKSQDIQFHLRPGNDNK
jgi:hypothetical protein